MRWRRRVCQGEPADRGQILLLLLGDVVVAVLLIVVAVDATAVFLARTQLRDAADAAALDAADEVDESAVLGQTLPAQLPLTAEGVRGAAIRYLEGAPRPPRLTDLAVGPATGSPDRRTAVVELTATVRLPLLGPVVRAWSGGVAITAVADARADVD